MVYDVLFSGGSDSTGMIYRLLKGGHTVHAHTIIISNNVGQTIREKLAVESLSKMFKKDFKNTYNHDGNIIEVTVNIPKRNDTPGYKQIPLLLTALQYLPPANNKTHRTAIGITKTDPEEYRTILSTKFNNELRYLPEVVRYDRLNRIPKLVFPVSTISRIKVWDALPNRYKKHVTWCEYSDELPEIIPNCGLIFSSGDSHLCVKCAEREHMINSQRKILKIKHREESSI